MAGTPTTVYELPTVAGGDNNDSVAAVNALAAALDALLLPRTLTTAQRDALSGGRRPTGLIVNNSTTGRLERWNGSAWETLDVVASAAAAAAQATAAAALPKSGGTMSGAIAMGSNKVTGLAKGTATGDAMARQQVQSGTVPPFTSLYTTISFSPSFASAPVVVATPTTDTSASIPSFWVTDVSASSARIWNGTAGAEAMGFNWIAVGD